MKILIEESVLRQALETFTHCYAETDRRINERAKLLVELRTEIERLEKVEPVAWVIVTNNKNVPDRHDSWLTFDIAEFKHNSAPCLTIAEVTPLYSTQSDTRIEREITAKQLGKQLAECERERDFQANAHKMAQDALLEQGQELATVTKERDELVEALTLIAFSCHKTVAKIAAEALAKLGADKTGEQHE